MSRPNITWWYADTTNGAGTVLHPGTEQFSNTDYTKGQVATITFGIVEAGTFSNVSNPTGGGVQHLYIWNNRKDPNGAAVTALPDMLNVTLRPVDVTGGPIGPISSSVDGNENQGRLEAMVVTTVSSVDKTGYWDASDAFVEDWLKVYVGSPLKVSTRGGKYGGGYNISGAVNSGVLSDTSNFAEIKMRLWIKPDADAGAVSYVTRLSYTYTP
jgi:hypothetical protein